MRFRLPTSGNTGDILTCQKFAYTTCDRAAALNPSAAYYRNHFCIRKFFLLIITLDLIYNQKVSLEIDIKYPVTS